jgi:nucleoside-diphosphate-sugar epimerase
LRILLTGATGFIGSRAATALLAAGHDVHALVRGAHATLPAGVAVERADLMDVGAVRDVVERLRPEACVPLAWYAVPGKYLHARENLDHLSASLSLIDALRVAGCRRIVTAGTCFEYQTDLGYLSEASPTAPRFLYSAAKHALYEVTREACRLAGSSHAHLRFFYQYGPGEADARLVPSVLRTLLRGEEARVTAGEQVRDFLHVDDVASAIRVVTESTVEGAVNVGSGVPITVRALVEAIAQACGRPDLVRFGALPYREGDPPFVCADVTKLKGLGWAPSIPLHRGLDEMAALRRGDA